MATTTFNTVPNIGRRAPNIYRAFDILVKVLENMLILGKTECSRFKDHCVLEL